MENEWTKEIERLRRGNKQLLEELIYLVKNAESLGWSEFMLRSAKTVIAETSLKGE
jgi:hypothetical protein